MCKDHEAQHVTLTRPLGTIDFVGAAVVLGAAVFAGNSFRLKLGLSVASVLVWLGLSFVALVALLVIRALTASSLQLSAADLKRVREEGDQAAAARLQSSERMQRLAQRLAGAIRFRTISFEKTDPEHKMDEAAMLGLHDYLTKQFPLVHRTLKREVVNKFRLLLRFLLLCLFSICSFPCHQFGVHVAGL